MTLIDAAVSGNRAINGGGISNGGNITLTNSAVAGNESSHDGGGIFNSGSIVLTNCTLTDNKAISGHGGGIWNIGSLTLTTSTVSVNTATAGGGIYHDQWSLFLSNSTISHNTSTNGSGGGIYNWKGEVTLTNSTASENAANIGTGGGIYSFNGRLKLIHGTLAGNTADGTNNDIHNYHEYALGTSWAVNTLVHNCAVDGRESRAIVDHGGNLDGGTGCGFTNASSKSNATLDLGVLADNGGPTLTMLPGATSDAMGFGLPSACSSAPVNSRDQRGYVRPAVGCTSGAVDPNGAANESIFFDGFGFGGQ